MSRSTDQSSMSPLQVGELIAAIFRNGLLARHVKALSSGKFLQQVLNVIEGKARIVPIENVAVQSVTKYLIDLDSAPFTPKDWKVEEHQLGGQFEFNPKRVGLYLDQGQKKSGVVTGHQLRGKLKSQPVFNANLLDFLLDHPQLIPEEWKGQRVFFWGTIYRYEDDNRYVRYLVWYDGQWDWNYVWLDNVFVGDDPAAVSASNL